MIEINLLPKNYRKGTTSLSFGKTGLYAIVGAVAVVAVLVGVSFYQLRQLSVLDTNIERANARADMLRADIQVVDALTDVKDKIQRRMTAVERLDRHRSAWVRILEDVARDVPEYVWLSEFREQAPGSEQPAETAKKGGKKGAKGEAAQEAETAAATVDAGSADMATRSVELRGYSFTLNALAAFMIRLMRSDYFDNVELQDTRDTIFAGNEKAYNFNMTANVHYLSDEELQNLVAQSDDSAVAEPDEQGLN